jgi:hypothetical protein
MLTEKLHKTAVYIVFFLLIAWILGSSLTPQIIYPDRSGHEATNEESEKLSIDRRIARYTLWLAGFTGVLALSTICLWIVTALTLRHSRETAERQLRAYVFVSSAAVMNVVEGDGIPEAQVVIKNFGQTPAYGFVNITGFAANIYPPPKSLRLTVPDDEFSKPIARSILGPTQAETSTTDWQEKRRPLTQDEKTAFTQGKAVIYVYGEIRYVDTFGRPQWTKYRYMMGGPVGIRAGGRLAPCEEGNEAS